MQREMELQQPPVQQEMKSQKGSVIAIDPDRPEVTQLTSCCRGKQPRTYSNAWGSVMFRFDFIRTRRPTKFSRSTTFLRGACGCEVHLRLTVSRRIPTVGRFGTKRENQRLLQPRDIFHCVRPEVRHAYCKLSAEYAHQLPLLPLLLRRVLQDVRGGTFRSAHRHCGRENAY